MTDGDRQRTVEQHMRLTHAHAGAPIKKRAYLPIAFLFVYLSFLLINYSDSDLIIG